MISALKPSILAEAKEIQLKSIVALKRRINDLTFSLSNAENEVQSLQKRYNELETEYKEKMRDNIFHNKKLEVKLNILRREKEVDLFDKEDKSVIKDNPHNDGYIKDIKELESRYDQTLSEIRRVYSKEKHELEDKLEKANNEIKQLKFLKGSFNKREFSYYPNIELNEADPEKYIAIKKENEELKKEIEDMKIYIELITGNSQSKSKWDLLSNI